MTDTVTIGRRFNGPPDSGNGGYVSGIIGSLINGPAQVTLRIPPPMEKALHLLREGDTLRLMDGDTLVAEGIPFDLSLDVPEPPSFAEAEAAVPGYTGFVDHTFPTCFVCGPQRDEGDGLRIFAGPVEGRKLVASPWTPHESLAIDGELPEAIYWSALDCPGAFAVMTLENPLVLGRMTAEIAGSVQPGEPCVVIGWSIGVEGRKHFAGTAIFNAAGDIVAKAYQTWIELKH